ncbi:MAG: hypothetical protein DI565_18540 [Ancylobacter novellus]|uniref:Uncharacterized protein n=1 Tax=Ancylobacter novellus TaxID=921 RepID=A0A2W5M1Q6_ANCNO|nr:MAG: hypothetical protein DI565_18540 [Ancylobacter novellus]
MRFDCCLIEFNVDTRLFEKRSAQDPHTIDGPDHGLRRRRARKGASSVVAIAAAAVYRPARRCGVIEALRRSSRARRAGPAGGDVVLKLFIRALELS